MTVKPLVERGRIERRILAGSNAPSSLRVERRSNGKSPPTLTGYAAVFNSLSEDLGGFREKIAPGAFLRSLVHGADPRGLLNHDPSWILARKSAGTLRVWETAKGLKIEIDPPATALGHHVFEAVRRGDITGMSFGFRVHNDSWEQTNDRTIRTLWEVELLDVSVVTFPAYPATEVEVDSQSPTRTSTPNLDACAARLRTAPTPYRDLCDAKLNSLKTPNLDYARRRLCAVGALL